MNNSAYFVFVEIFYSCIMMDNALVAVTDHVNTISVRYMFKSDFGSLPDVRENTIIHNRIVGLHYVL